MEFLDTIDIYNYNTIIDIYKLQYNTINILSFVYSNSRSVKNRSLMAFKYYYIIMTKN